MKTIQLIDRGDFKARDVLKHVLENTKKGMDVAEMRQRLKILDVLDAAKGTTVDLEDADHAVLVNKIKETSFTVANRDLFAVLDEVLNPAKEKLRAV